MGVDPCTGGQSVQDWKRRDNRVQRAVQITLRVKGGEGFRAREVTGKIQKTFERWYGDK